MKSSGPSARSFLQLREMLLSSVTPSQAQIGFANRNFFAIQIIHLIGRCSDLLVTKKQETIVQARINKSARAWISSKLNSFQPKGVVSIIAIFSYHVHCLS